VHDLAKRLNAPFYLKKFDTKDFASSQGLSIQMAARDLRYTWFKELIESEDYRYLATAHHKDDFAETVILNLVKGSVLKGLHGILPKSGAIIRPLLWAEKAEIAAYASYKNIKYREDHSNAENKYQRNLVRNEVIPLLKQVNTDISDTIYRSAGRRQQLEILLGNFLKDLKAKIMIHRPGSIAVKISDLKESGIMPETFYEFIEDYGFTYDQVEDLFSGLDNPQSKVFYSGMNFRMVKDRSEILIAAHEHVQSKEITIEKDTVQIEFSGYTFHFDVINASGIDDLRIQNTAYLDLHSLQFPLTIRNWKPGDTFHPFGLKGKKKLSDFFTDLKLSFHQKENQTVVVSGAKICWVAGLRIDDGFKVNPHTQKVFRIRLGN
jgi:tRNA(Ile)-lysidine synthase